MKNLSNKDLDITLKNLLKNRSKEFLNKPQNEVIDGIYQELKFLGLVSMKADHKNPTYNYLQIRIPQILEEEIELLSSK